MRARLARPRRIVRGRLVAPVAAAAAVALVGGVVVATPDTPTVREDVQTVATVIPGLQVGVEFSYDLNDLGWAGSMAGFEATEVTGLPDGLTFGGGIISGTPTQSGLFDVVVSGTMDGAAVNHTVQLVVADAEGNLPAGAQAGSSGAVQGSLGGEAEAGGQIATGSEGTDSLLGAVASIVVALGGDAGSVADLATGSTGDAENTENPSSPLGSVSESLMGTTPDNGEPTPGEQTPGSDSLGSSATGEVEGEGAGNLNTESLGPLGSLIDTETGTETGSNTGGETTGGAELVTEGQVTVPGSTVPGSTTTGTTGSLGDLAPGLALTGAALLGLAGLSIVLNGGSSAPGASSSIPALLGSSANGTTGSGPGSTSSGPGTSSGSVAPTVAAGSPNRVQEAPGPTVANGRG